MQKGCGICGQLLNKLRENFLNNDIHYAAFVAKLAQPAYSSVEPPNTAFRMTVAIALMAGAAALYFVKPSAAESVTVRCERQAVIAAGDKRDFRRERKIAFERCMDESLQTRKKPAS